MGLTILPSSKALANLFRFVVFFKLFAERKLAQMITPNVVLTGAGHETSGNGAPYHRVRLKTLLGG